MNTESSSVPPAPPLDLVEDRTVAILSYLTLIGFIVAVVIHSTKKTSLGAFHLRQVLGLFVVGFVAWIAAIILAFIPFIGWIAALAIYFALFGAWIHGLIMAAGGRKEPIPVVGLKIQDLFKGAFA